MKKSKIDSDTRIPITEGKKNLDNKIYLGENIHSTQQQKINYDPDQFITAMEIKYYFEFSVLNFVCDIAFN
jgi:hypothetical protein